MQDVDEVRKGWVDVGRDAGGFVLGDMYLQNGSIQEVSMGGRCSRGTD